LDSTRAALRVADDGSFLDRSAAAENGAVPAIHRDMTLLTVRGEACGHMIRSAGFAKHGHVAAHAFGGESEAVELADGADLMAGVAVYGGVRADQGKAVLMLIDVVNRDLPAVRVMAEFALRAVFAAMQIGMTILTFLRGIAEYERFMTIGALYFGVPAAQRKFRLRVLELKPGAERFPALCGVTFLALDFEFVAVRTSHSVIG
jgi:hypothetical protein